MPTIQLPIPKDRNLMFTQNVTNESIAVLTKAILEIQNDDEYLVKLYDLHDVKYTPKPIRINVDSYGGQVYQCLGLLSVMKNCTTPIHTIVTGCAMSCGFLISISGHKRFGHKLATYMYHQISSADWGKLKDLEEGIIEAKRLQTIIEQHTIEQTKITAEKLQDVYEKKQDWFMDSKQALKLGVIDEIL